MGICLLRAADLQKILPPDLLLWKFRQISFFHSEKEKFFKDNTLSRRFDVGPALGTLALRVYDPCNCDWINALACAGVDSAFNASGYCIVSYFVTKGRSSKSPQE